MALNFNDAEKQKGFGDLIPANTACRVSIKIRPGGSGEGGWLKASKSGDKRMVDMELTIVNGKYAKRKIWELMTVEADEESDNITTALNISRTRIRAILESVRGIKPEDQSDAAQKQRQIDHYGQLDGMEFATTIRIEKSKDPQYPDKNRIGNVITPEAKDYAAVMSGAEFNNAVGAGVKAAGGSVKPSGKPSWAS